jgi:hypothetical protein
LQAAAAQMKTDYRFFDAILAMRRSAAPDCFIFE